MTNLFKSRGFLSATVVATAFLLQACAPEGGDYMESVEISQPAPTLTHTSTVACNAGSMGWLIGQPESTLAAVTLPAPVRIIQAGEAVTMDHNPSRLNVQLDVTGRISSLTCG
ncbi:MAG: I78 family peptidase inhibitor [Alphaproteobacteria bacterium]